MPDINALVTAPVRAVRSMHFDPGLGIVAAALQEPGIFPGQQGMLVAEWRSYWRCRLKFRSWASNRRNLLAEI